MLANRKQLDRTEPASNKQGELWAIVLAGGKGTRLRALTRHLYGEERPKQYAALVGSRSLLRQTLDRVSLRIPPERTLLVSLRDQVKYLEVEFAGSPTPRVLMQPQDRGTAPAILLAAHRIHWWDPDATIAVFPSDHFILDETAFMDDVLSVASAARRPPQRIVLLGAQPTGAETEYGWIEPGKPLVKTESAPLLGVRRFWEKPSAETARDCLARGCLWNTFVFVAKASALIDAGRNFLPELHDLFTAVAPFADTESEERAIEKAYAKTLDANFSNLILARCPSSLAVWKLPELAWCDWGTPERVVRSLRQAGISSPWMEKHNEISAVVGTSTSTRDLGSSSGSANGDGATAGRKQARMITGGKRESMAKKSRATQRQDAPVSVATRKKLQMALPPSFRRHLKASIRESLLAFESLFAEAAKALERDAGKEPARKEKRITLQ